MLVQALPHSTRNNKRVIYQAHDHAPDGACSQHFRQERDTLVIKYKHRRRNKPLTLLFLE